MDDPRQYAGPDVETSDLYLPICDRLSLRCITFTPSAPQIPTKVLFIPGWISLLNSWRNVLPCLTSKLPVIYVETREKATSRVQGTIGFSVRDFASDICAIVRSLTLIDNRYVIVAGSLGATAALEAVAELPAKPLCMVLVLPNARFGLPPWTWMLRLIPKFLLPGVKKCVQWYIARRILNPTDYGHLERFLASFRHADIVKLRDSAVALQGYQADWARLARIHVPCLIVGASSDQLHDQQGIIQIAQVMPFCIYHDLRTFTDTHGAAALKDMLNFIGNRVNEHNDK